MAMGKRARLRGHGLGGHVPLGKSRIEPGKLDEHSMLREGGSTIKQRLKQYAHERHDEGGMRAYEANLKPSKNDGSLSSNLSMKDTMITRKTRNRFSKR